MPHSTQRRSAHGRCVRPIREASFGVIGRLRIKPKSPVQNISSIRETVSEDDELVKR